VKYFKISEDRNIENLPVLIGFVDYIVKARTIDDEDNIVRVKPKRSIKYTDYMDKTLLCVSDVFKSVVELYHHDYVYKTVVLLNKDSGSQKLYWNIEMPDEAKCLSSKTTYYAHNGTLKDIVVNEKAAEGLSMFRIKDKLWNTYIVRLDMAESLLRRGLYGFTLKELAHES